MSIVCESPKGYVIDHESFVQKLYGNVHENDSVSQLVYQKDIYKIHAQYTDRKASKSNKRKRKFVSGEVPEGHTKEVKLIKESFHILLDQARECGYLLPSYCASETENEKARTKANSFYLESSKWEKKIFSGSNNLSFPVIQEVVNENYVFPALCTFFCNDIHSLDEKLVALKVKYDFILLDPPWWNKYIRRKKSKCVESSYQMMYNEELKKIPVLSLLNTNGLIAVWCTNSQQNINTLVQEIFPVWNVKYVGKWFWLKVTRFGEPICSFADPPGKQPYERIIFACKSISDRDYALPEDGKVIISIPSAIHSHKPPISEVLSSYLPPEPNCLELFARYLLPKWTSWGNEVLKLQHVSLFEKVV